MFLASSTRYSGNAHHASKHFLSMARSVSSVRTICFDRFASSILSGLFLCRELLRQFRIAAHIFAVQKDLGNRTHGLPSGEFCCTLSFGQNVYVLELDALRGQPLLCHVAV